jgi:hypothetical protein
MCTHHRSSNIGRLVAELGCARGRFMAAPISMDTQYAKEMSHWDVEKR